MAERGTQGGLPRRLTYCFNQALVGGICELMRMKVSQPWRGSRQFEQSLCKLPCASPGADLPQDEWGPRASPLARPSIARISQPRGGRAAGLPIIAAVPPSIPAFCQRRRHRSLLQTNLNPDLHRACYFSPGNPKVAGLGSFVVFTHVPSGLS